MSKLEKQLEEKNNIFLQGYKKAIYNIFNNVELTDQQVKQLINNVVNSIEDKNVKNELTNFLLNN